MSEFLFLEYTLVGIEFGIVVTIHLLFGNMDQTQVARIQFNQLKGFPTVIDDKLETEAFLEASNEIVEVIRK